MKRVICFLLTLFLALPAFSLAELDEEELEFEDFDVEAGIPVAEAVWEMLSVNGRF